MRPVLLLLLLALSARAAIHEVHPGQSIQAAVQAAAPLDTVLLYDGPYCETVVLYGKTLTIGSLYLMDGDTSHITATSVIPDFARPDTASCFVYTHNEGIEGRLVGLTITAGRGTVRRNPALPAGGGVAIFGGRAQVEACRLYGCEAAGGGGMAVMDDEYRPARAIIRNCQIRDCRALYIGGGVRARNCSLEVRNTVFLGDTCFDMAAGGLDIADSEFIVDSCHFLSCYGEAAALHTFNSFGSVTGSFFSDNGAPWRAGGTHLRVDVGMVTVRGNSFFATATDTEPVHFLAGRISFVGNLIENTYTADGNGALGMGAAGGLGTGEVAYNIFRNNSGSYAGALYTFQDCNVRIHHNVIEGALTERPDQWGSVLTTVTDAQPTLDSNIIRLNGGQTLNPHPLWGGRTIHAENNWWGHASGPYHPTLNPAGQGDTLLSDSVFFIPWLTSPPDTTLPQGDVRERPELAGTWELLSCYPNPFNSTLRIAIAGFAGRDFRLSLYNLLGQEVAVLHEGSFTGGEFSFTAPSGMASGVYFLHAHDGRTRALRKIVLLR